MFQYPHENPFRHGIAAKWGSELTFQFMKARGKKLKDLGLEPYAESPEERLKSICGGKG